jgi:ubiquitin-protein ligase
MSGVREILIQLMDLFRNPQTDHPLNQAIAEVYANNKKQFIKLAKESTKKHASTKK